MIKTTLTYLLGMVALCAFPAQAESFPTERTTPLVAVSPTGVDLNKNYRIDKPAPLRTDIQLAASVRGERIHAASVWQLGYALGALMDKPLRADRIHVGNVWQLGFALGALSARSNGGSVIQVRDSERAWMQALDPTSCLEPKLASGTLVEVTCQ